MTEETSQAGAESPANPATPPPAENAGAAPPAPTPQESPAPTKAEHPATRSISTARQMIANGQTPEYASDWLSRNCPDSFKGAADALEAIQGI